MANWKLISGQSEEVQGRANRPNHMYSYCRVIGCRRPARAGTSDGLDTRYCRSHADHHQRHGSPFKGSYPARVVNPYRRAALEWLVAHEDAYWTKHSIAKVKGLYRRAGARVEAFRLRGLRPQERAWAHWARMRDNQIDPRLVIAAWLAVEMVIADDPEPVTTSEFKRVQAAKIVHRMASGTHKRWERERPHPLHPGLPPVVEVEEKHWYPKSRGRVLRHIGETLERAVELLVEHHLKEIRAAYYARQQATPGNARPYPRRFAARRRK